MKYYQHILTIIKRVIITVAVMSLQVISAMAGNENILRESVYNNVNDIFVLLRALYIPFSCLYISTKFLYFIKDPTEENARRILDDVLWSVIGIIVFFFAPAIIDKAISSAFGVGNIGMTEQS